MKAQVHKSSKELEKGGVDISYNKKKQAQAETFIVCMVDACKRNDGEGSCMIVGDIDHIQIHMGLTGRPECSDFEPKEGWPAEEKPAHTKLPLN